MSHVVVLVAIANRTTRSRIKAEFASSGRIVLLASSGSEALELSRAFEGVIHAVLTEIRLPGLDGRALARVLREERPGILHSDRGSQPAAIANLCVPSPFCRWC